MGAAGSAALFLRAGLHSPRLLLVLMAIWVFTPFVAILVVLKMSKSWPARAQSMFDGATLVVTLGTLVAYAYDAIRPPAAQAAFAYVMVPPVSVIALTAALLAAWLVTRGASRATGV